MVPSSAPSATCTSTATPRQAVLMALMGAASPGSVLAGGFGA